MVEGFSFCRNNVLHASNRLCQLCTFFTQFHTIESIEMTFITFLVYVQGAMNASEIECSTRDQVIVGLSFT